MYHPISINGLSNAQINKMLAGHPVRVKHGKQHQIKVSTEQYKKHVKSAQKGKGFTIMLDPYQQEMHRTLRGQGIMSSLKKIAGQARTAFGHAKKAVGQASKFYGENKETLEPYGSILKKQAHGKIEHYSEKAQPHLTKHLGEFGSHLGSHASKVAHENIESFGELPQYELPESISEQSIVENELEGSGLRRSKVKRTTRGGKINFGKVLSKVGNVAVKGVSDYAKSKQGQALIQHGIKLGTDAILTEAGLHGGKINIGKVLSKVGNTAKSYLKSNAGIQLVNRGLTAGLTGLAGATGQPELLMAQPIVTSIADRAIHGLGMKKRGRPKKGGALYAAGYGSY